MPSNRNLLWVVLVGAVLVVAAYYLGANRSTVPLAIPAATAPAEKPAAAAPAEKTTADSDPTPGDLTAADAAQTVKRIEDEQQQQMQMMEKSRLPGDGEWVDGPGEDPPQKN